MTKVSTNAGKHPYRRSDYVPPVVIEKKMNGIPFSSIVKFKAIVPTDYKDKKGKMLFFKDVIKYEKEEYEIGYNGKEFYWEITGINNPKNTYRLSDVNKSVFLVKKYNKNT